MTDKELHKLGRRELLQLMLAQGREAEKAKQELAETQEEFEQLEEGYERLKQRLDDKDAQIHKLRAALQTMQDDAGTMNRSGILPVAIPDPDDYYALPLEPQQPVQVAPLPVEPGVLMPKRQDQISGPAQGSAAGNRIVLVNSSARYQIVTVRAGRYRRNGRDLSQLLLNQGRNVPGGRRRGAILCRGSTHPLQVNVVRNRVSYRKNRMNLSPHPDERRETSMRKFCGGSQRRAGAVETDVSAEATAVSGSYESQTD